MFVLVMRRFSLPTLLLGHIAGDCLLLQLVRYEVYGFFTFVTCTFPFVCVLPCVCVASVAAAVMLFILQFGLRSALPSVMVCAMCILQYVQAAFASHLWGVY